MSNTSAILDEFEHKQKSFARFEAQTRHLLDDMIQSSGISIHSLQARTKTRDSLRAKCERQDKNYQHLADITDVVGFRIITYFDDDVDKVASRLGETFTVDAVRSVDKRVLKPREFGYTALHYVCRYGPGREELPENRNFGGIHWEVQICSILQHAWNEIEHDIGYKAQSKVSTEIERRLSRLSGTLELIDDEFREIRNLTTNYRRALEVRLEAEDADVSDVGIDTISLRLMFQKDKTSIRADELVSKKMEIEVRGDVQEKTLAFIVAGAQVLGLRTLQSIKALLEEHMHDIPLFLSDYIKGLEADNAEVVIGAVKKGAGVTQMIMYLLALRGFEDLSALYSQLGTFGEEGDRMARVQTKAAIREQKGNVYD